MSMLVTINIMVTGPKVFFPKIKPNDPGVERHLLAMAETLLGGGPIIKSHTCPIGKILSTQDFCQGQWGTCSFSWKEFPKSKSFYFPQKICWLTPYQNSAYTVISNYKDHFFCLLFYSNLGGPCPMFGERIINSKNFPIITYLKQVKERWNTEAKFLYINLISLKN